MRFYNLKEEWIGLDGHEIYINPISRDKSGSLEEYLTKAEEYLVKNLRPSQKSKQKQEKRMNSRQRNRWNGKLRKRKKPVSKKNA